MAKTKEEPAFPFSRMEKSEKEETKRRTWSSMEDKILKNYIQLHGVGNWRDVPGKAGLKRCGKSCRLRWVNYLKPGIKRGNISEDEEDLIIRLHKLLGNRWSLIAGRLPGRTDNEIRRYWNNKLSKRVQRTDSNNFKAMENLAFSKKVNRESPCSSEEVNSSKQDKQH